MADGIVDDLITAVDAVAATFDGRGSQIRERELEVVLESALWAIGREPQRQHRLYLEQAWEGRVGGVDLALDSAGDTILIELKWDPATLAACAWDQVKLASALQAGEGSRAFLIGGSPESPDLRGDELLEDATFDPVSLRDRYAREFDYWKADVMNRPRFAPSGWRTRRLHSASLRHKDEDWRIRLAELELAPTDLVAFE